MTYQEIRDLAYKEIRSAKNNFKINVHEYLRENHLDQIVERISDGRKGVLLILENTEETVGYEIKFYPITKRGIVSQKASGYVSWREELTETYREAK